MLQRWADHLRPHVPGQIIYGSLDSSLATSNSGGGSSKRTPVLPDGSPGWIKEPDAAIGLAKDKTPPLLFEVAWSQNTEDLVDKVADYADLGGKVRTVITLDMEYRAPHRHASSASSGTSRSYPSSPPLPPNAHLCLYRFNHETDDDTGEVTYAMDLESELDLPYSTSTTTTTTTPSATSATSATPTASRSNPQPDHLILTLQDFTPLALSTDPETAALNNKLGPVRIPADVFRKAIDDSFAKTCPSPRIPAASAAVLGDGAKRRPMRKKKREEELERDGDKSGANAMVDMEGGKHDELLSSSFSSVEAEAEDASALREDRSFRARGLSVSDRLMIPVRQLPARKKKRVTTHN